MGPKTILGHTFSNTSKLDWSKCQTSAKVRFFYIFFPGGDNKSDLLIKKCFTFMQLPKHL